MGAAGGDRWQGGECGTYATALQQMRPGLMIGAAGGGPGDDEEDWDVEHFFAHDQTHAYDSTGRHELPYSSRWQHSILNINPHHFDVLSAEHPPDSAEAERAIAQAERHIIGHRILEGREHTQHPGPDPIEDRRPGSLDERPPSDLDATNPRPPPPRARNFTSPGTSARRPSRTRANSKRKCEEVTTQWLTPAGGGRTWADPQDGGGTPRAPSPTAPAALHLPHPHQLSTPLPATPRKGQVPP